MPAHPIPLALRFWRRVNTTPTCWLWIGKTNNQGYGVFRYYVPRREMLAHRQVWVWAFGPIPRGLNVLHRCDTPRCIRPDHLFLGTPLDNSADMVKKGRQASAERNGRSRLNRQAVAVMKFLAARGVSRVRLGRAYGVDGSYVARILAGHIWAERLRT